MTIAEQLAEKWVAEDRDPWAFTEDAINEALELAAQEADTVAHSNEADFATAGAISIRIRALKSPAQEPESA